MLHRRCDSLGLLPLLQLLYVNSRRPVVCMLPPHVTCAPLRRAVRSLPLQLHGTGAPLRVVPKLEAVGRQPLGRRMSQHGRMGAHGGGQVRRYRGVRPHGGRRLRGLMGRGGRALAEGGGGRCGAGGQRHAC